MSQPLNPASQSVAEDAKVVGHTLGPQGGGQGGSGTRSPSSDAHSSHNAQGSQNQGSHGAQGGQSSQVADTVDAVVDRAAAGDLGGVASELKGAAGGLKSAAVEQGRVILENAKTQATSFADERKDDAAQTVSDLAASLRETGRSFSERPNISAFANTAADGLDQLANQIRERSFAEMYGEVEAYARRAPVTVGAVALGLGFLLARFIKSSSDELAEKGQAIRREAEAASRRKGTARSASLGA